MYRISIIVISIGILTGIFFLSMPATYARANTNEAFATTQMSKQLRQSIQALGATPTTQIPIPILFGVTTHDLADTWKDARSAGRVHEGIDIFAPRGMFIVSPTDAVVVSVGYGSLGGNYVYTVNPGSERYYYAHLESVAPGLQRGDTLRRGDLIGYVGNSGNARGGRTHLHFGIYTPQVINPYPRLTKSFTEKEVVRYLSHILNTYPREPANMPQSFQGLYDTYKSVAQAKVNILKNKTPTFSGAPGAPAAPHPYQLIQFGKQNTHIVWLQKYLIKQDTGKASQILARIGATGYFGDATKSALREFQKKAHIFPSSGYYGPITQAYITHMQSKQTTATFTRNLKIGSRGADVLALQRLLNKHGFTIATEGAGAPGHETAYFGKRTKKSLQRLQRAQHITPASGYFGPITRARVATL